MQKVPVLFSGWDVNGKHPEPGAPADPPSQAELSGQFLALKAKVFGRGRRAEALRRPGMVVLVKTPAQQQIWVDVTPASEVLKKESPVVRELST